MIGTNCLKVNQATMNLIVQKWVDENIGPTNVVQSVKAEDQYSFEIQLSAPDSAPSVSA